MQSYLRKAALNRSMVGVQARYFGAAHHAETPGKASGRKTANPGWYNKRFEPSSSLDGNYFDFQARVRGADGFEPRQTNRDPNAFKYSNNLFKNDYWEYRMRLADYLY